MASTVAENVWAAERCWDRADREVKRWEREKSRGPTDEAFVKTCDKHINDWLDYRCDHGPDDLVGDVHVGEAQ